MRPIVRSALTGPSQNLSPCAARLAYSPHPAACKGLKARAGRLRAVGARRTAGTHQLDPGMSAGRDGLRASRFNARSKHRNARADGGIDGSKWGPTSVACRGAVKAASRNKESKEARRHRPAPLHLRNRLALREPAGCAGGRFACCVRGGAKVAVRRLAVPERGGNRDVTHRASLTPAPIL
jgi:hypothetical protein